MSIFEMHRRRLEQVRGELEASKALNRELLELLEGIIDLLHGAPDEEAIYLAREEAKAAIAKAGVRAPAVIGAAGPEE